MREVLADIRRWHDDGQEVAVATVVKVWGSAPRPLGSRMAISSGGDMVGSVSGGCVEGAVFEEAQSVLATGEPKRLEYGVSNDRAWAVGLSCGGEIEIWVERVERPGRDGRDEAGGRDRRDGRDKRNGRDEGSREGPAAGEGPEG